MTAKTLWRTIAAMAASLAITPASWSQITEIEPNDTCAEAHVIGEVTTLPLAVLGELVLDYSAEPPGDVDFYQYTAPPGTALRANLRGAESGAGTLYNGYLGLFDSACNLLAENYQYQGAEPKINFTVPEDGIFILAATGCCSFDGWNWSEGTYRLSLTQPPVPVTAITGRLVDAVTGAPLAGNMPPYSWVELRRCRLAGCIYQVASLSPDESGAFSFETDYYGNPLDPGDYMVGASANDYQFAEVGPFTAVSAEVTDLGDIALQPPPFVIENIVPCADIPAGGGTCKYSVDMRNNTGSDIRGLSWSLVNAWGGSSVFGYTYFQTDKAQATRVGAFSSRTVSFSFKVPGEVAEGTSMCTEAWFSDREASYFGTLRQAWLFCVMKQYGSYTVMDPKAAASLMGVESLESKKNARSKH